MERNAAKDLEDILKLVFDDNAHKDGAGIEHFNLLDHHEQLIRDNIYDPTLRNSYHQQFERVRSLLIDALIEATTILVRRKEPSNKIDRLLANIAAVRISSYKFELAAIIHKCKNDFAELGIK